ELKPYPEEEVEKPSREPRQDVKPVASRVPKKEVVPKKKPPAPMRTKSDDVKSIHPSETGDKKTSYLDLIIVLILSIVTAAISYFSPLPYNEYVFPALIFLVLSLLSYALIAVFYPKPGRLSILNHVLGSLELAVVMILIYGAFTFYNLINGLPNYTPILLAVLTILLLIWAFLRKRKYKPIPVKVDIPHPWKDKIEAKKLQDDKEAQKAAMFPWIARQNITDEAYSSPEITPPRYTDLILIVFSTLLTAVFVLVPSLNQTPLRTVLGIFLVLFIPGYSLIAALFPKNDDLDGIERVALSFGLSIAVTPLIGLALNYTPWGIRLDPILICLTGFTLLMCLIAYLRRRTISEDERYSVSFGLFFSNLRGSFQGKSRIDKLLSIILILTILLAIGATAYIIIKPKQGEKFTEFYILGPDGKASGYPTNLTTGQNASMIIGVVNHEQVPTTYKLVVNVGNITLKDETITLKDKEKMEIPFTFTASEPGQKKMEFLLYKLPNQTDVYRNLHLWYTIS
ncbi:MAG TPA: DUF1616 domain-containing protein, partial [Methanobacteriaceae archaeon]|nr:DUF1616 domain-containing protein [Methanobacteriaceae archaeon]